MNIIIYNKAIIATWQLEIDNLKEQIASVDRLSSMNATERGQKIQPLIEKIDSLNADIVKCNKFLTDLETNPQILVKQFSDKILNSLKEYEKNNSKNLPIQIRVCLYKLDKKLDFINQSTESQLPKPAIQIQYLKLCTLVQDMLQEVNNKKTDPIFIKLLEDLLESTHIAIEGDLPDKMRTGQTTTTYLRELKQDSDLFPDSRQLLAYEKKHLKDAHITIKGDLPKEKQASQTATGDRNESTPTPEPIEEQLATEGDIPKEKQASETVTGDSDESTSTPEPIEEQYDKILKKLQTRLVVKNTLQTKIDRTVAAVDAEVRAKKQKQEIIDYHFYNQLLVHLWDLSNPKTTTDNATFITFFTELTEDVIDTPSLGEKVAGAILAIIGILLIAVSIATLAATFCGSSLVSSVGIALGISLLSSQIVLSTTAVVAAAVGAGLTFWGINKFKEEQGRELSQAIYEVTEELTHLPPTPAPAMG